MILGVFVVKNRSRKLKEGLEGFFGAKRGHFQCAFGCFGVFPRRGAEFCIFFEKEKQMIDPHRAKD